MGVQGEAAAGDGKGGSVLEAALMQIRPIALLGVRGVWLMVRHIWLTKSYPLA